MTDRDIADAVREIIEAGAPNWFIPAYTRMLYIQDTLDRHLQGHEKASRPWREIGWSAVSALIMAVMWWLLLQAPVILGAR